MSQTSGESQEQRLSHRPDQEGEIGQGEEDGSTLNASTRFSVQVLLFSILLVALCSITYELIIGTISSYLLGNSVFQFSLTIGLYMSAMGVGSYASKFVRRDLLTNFIIVELLIGVLGGVSSAVLFGVFTYQREAFSPAMWAITLAIGALVGLEIPLLTRYVRRFAQLRDAIANVLSWDYIGALFGSLAFPLVLLPTFGLLNSAAIMGLLNLAVAAVGLIAFRAQIKRFKALLAALLISAVGLMALFFWSDAYDNLLDRRLFQDPVIYREQTAYQKLTLTAWRDRDYRLYINGNIQFASVDEYRYHESLVHVPMGLVPEARRVLVLGGGDGLAVAQLVRHYPELERIVLVDLDPRMTRLAKEHPILRRLNDDALLDKRVEIVHDDAMNYLMRRPEPFDVVILDLPDPNNESLAKLYSVEFYRLLRQALTEEGVAVTQSSAAFHAPNAFWSIHRSMERAFCPDQPCTTPEGEEHVIAYHALVPSFGDWGFNLAMRQPRRRDALTVRAQEGTRFISEETLRAMVHFPQDIAEREVKPNRLIEPVLLSYYQSDWAKNNQ